VETGSIQAASTTTQSCAKRDFLVFAKYPRFCAGAQAGFRSLQGGRTAQRQFGAFRLWRPKTVSWSAGKERQETRFACDRDRFPCKSFERIGTRCGHARVDGLGAAPRGSGRDGSGVAFGAQVHCRPRPFCGYSACSVKRRRRGQRINIAGAVLNWTGMYL
jgi:hypothetical protein